jgi:hypothetical protein
MQTKDIYTRSTAFKSSEARCGFRTRIYEALELATRAQQQHKSKKYKPTETNIFTDGGLSRGATICAPQKITSNARKNSYISKTCITYKIGELLISDQYPTYTESEKHCWRWQRLGRCKLANSRVWCSSGRRQPLVIHHHSETPMTSVACLTHKYNRTLS